MNKSDFYEVYGNLDPNRFPDTQKYFLGINIIVAFVFFTTTAFVVIKSFWGSHPVFSVFLSVLYALFNLGVFYLFSSRLMAGKNALLDERIEYMASHMVDRSLIKDGFFSVFLQSNSQEVDRGYKYYPELKSIVQPLFSKSGLFGGYTYKLFVLQASISFLFICYSQQQMLFKEVLLASVIAFLFNIVWYVQVNSGSLRLAVEHLKQGEVGEHSVISMDRSLKQTQELLSEDIKHSLKSTPLDMSEDTINTLWNLYYEAVDSVFEFNDFNALVLDKPSFFQNSVDDVSYIVNELLPKRIKAVNLFFKNYSSKDAHSMQVFKSEVVSKMHEEFIDYSKKLRKFKELLVDAKEIDKRYIAQNIYLDDRIKDTRHINVDAISNHLYPELRGLEFSDLKNRVAAQNISSNLLPELHSLLEIAETQEDIDEIKAQIEDVKKLLFSLSDTKSIEGEKTESLLELTPKQDNGNLISQTLERQKIYMKSYKDRV